VPRTAPILARYAAFTLAIVAPIGAPALADTPCAGLEPGPAHSVTRVLDGETVVLDDGRELRLVGTLAPRALEVDAEPGAWPAEAAATEALRALVLGRSIELWLARERTDRYGRLQAQAFAIETDGGRRWVQGAMLQQGHGRAYALPGDLACSADLLAAERPAREGRRGLWASAAYQVRSADNPAELMRYRATFQVVAGTVVRVAHVRETIYLNFDRNWRRGSPSRCAVMRAPCSVSTPAIRKAWKAAACASAAGSSSAAAALSSRHRPAGRSRCWKCRRGPTAAETANPPRPRSMPRWRPTTGRSRHPAGDFSKVTAERQRGGGDAPASRKPVVDRRMA
jgi:endonuclease YncB( thermonuclease family)